MSYKKGCGIGYCCRCGDCLDEEDIRKLKAGICLTCGAEIPAGDKSCPVCHEYVIPLAVLEGRG